MKTMKILSLLFTFTFMASNAFAQFENDEALIEALKTNHCTATLVLALLILFRKESSTTI
jgi:hypothetical protein